MIRWAALAREARCRPRRVAARGPLGPIAIAAGAVALLSGCGHSAHASGRHPGRAEVERLRPPIVRRYIPLPTRRRRETAAFALRHYGLKTYRLRHPRVIVEHVAVATTIGEVYNTFAPDLPDSQLHELPGFCTHFFVAADGTIYQLAPLTFMCRHVGGLNYTAIGIEHAGLRDSDVLDNPRELAASLRLTNWLSCRYDIALRNVIGHAENLRSPYWRERNPRLRRQLRASNDRHIDWSPTSMVEYAHRLLSLRC
jgi:N-acetylmuramoyl-L-alanine amidase